MSSRPAACAPPLTGDGQAGCQPAGLMVVGPVVAEAWGYRHPGRERWAITGADFQLRPGSLTLLLGASGSGKSTLLRGMAGLLGQGQSAGRLRAPGPIGYVGQDPADNIVMERVDDDVAFPLENLAVSPSLIWPRVGAALAEVGLPDHQERITTELSGGQTQLLALAAAIAAEPALLLLDEPTANLDPQAAERVVAAVLAVQATSGCSVVVVEHRVSAWLARADHALLVHPPGSAGPQVELLAPQDVPARVAAAPELAGQVWLGPVAGMDLRPAAPPGEVVLRVRGVAVTGRLAGPVDLTLCSGEVLALVGAPGSGKSTLLNVICGLATPDAGRVAVSTADQERVDPWRWRAAEVSGTFGVVFQDPADQFLTSRVDAELGHGLAVAGVGPDEAASRVADLARQFGLADLLAVSPFTLSGGQARRLSVGTALIGRPQILVLDEPTFGQDPQSWAAIVAIIAAHRDRGGAVMLATHDPELIRVLGAREFHLQAAEPGGASGGPIRLGAAPGMATGALRQLNPLALLACATLTSVAALASGSTRTNIVLALGALAVGLLGGAPRRRLGVLLAPALLAGASAALSNAMLAPGGLSEASNWAAAALPATRIIAVAIPGLIAALSIDPTALADALTQQVRVPARVAYSVLAGLRLIPLLGQQWLVLRLANRARGLAGRGIAGRAREFTSLVFRLLIGALRRGSGLALALDARGLGPGPRTVARPQRFWWPDALGLLATVLLVAVAWLAGG